MQQTEALVQLKARAACTLERTADVERSNGDFVSGDSLRMRQYLTTHIRLPERASFCLCL